MLAGYSPRLFNLADREFRHLTGKPAALVPARKFKPMRLDPSKFYSRWDRKCGAAVRLTAVLLDEDDTTLEHRVCASERS